MVGPRVGVAVMGCRVIRVGTLEGEVVGGELGGVLGELDGAMLTPGHNHLKVAG